MRNAFRFLKSPTGNFTIWVAFAAIGGGLIYQSSSSAKRQTEQMSKVETLNPEEIKETILRDGKVLNIPNPATQPVPNSPETKGNTASGPAETGKGTREEVRPR